MAIKQLTEPAADPLTDIEVREHLNLDDDVSPTLLSAFITAARQRAESFAELVFVQRNFGFYIDGFTSKEIRIPIAPLKSVVSVKYYDTNNVEQTLDPASYYVDSVSRIGRIVAVDCWPDTFPRPNAVTITVTAGYGTADDVPQVLKQAMLLMVGDMYENREETTTDRLALMPITSELLLRPFKLLG